MTIGDGVPKMVTARAGYDVETANDRELSFNSAWSLLPIQAEGTFQVNNELSEPVIIFHHGLGYPPVFELYYEKDGYIYALPDEGSVGTTCTVDSENLYWRSVYFHATPMNLYWKLYRRPITLNENTEPYTLTGVATKPGIDGKIIVARPNKDIDSTDYRDIGFNGQWKQLIIDSSRYAAPDPEDPYYYTITINHGLGYKPMYKGFYLDTNNEWRQMPAMDIYRATVTTTSISYRLSTGSWGGDGPTMALLLFKSTINNDV